MIVYHGSSMEIQKPDVDHSKKYLDFGKGFYVTTYPKQAEKWALRKAMRRGAQPVVNVYEMDDSFSDVKVLNFGGYTAEWLDFVCSCRKGQDAYKEYDIIIGNVADDDVFKTVDFYFSGVWDRERTIQELRFFKKNDQIVFVTQSTIEKKLNFLRSYTVEKR